MKSDLGEEDEDEDADAATGRYQFADGYPGGEFSYLQERKHAVVPIISLTRDSICCIKDLEMASNKPSDAAVLY